MFYGGRVKKEERRDKREEKREKRKEIREKRKERRDKREERRVISEQSSVNSDERTVKREGLVVIWQSPSTKYPGQPTGYDDHSIPSSTANDSPDYLKIEVWCL
jgi:hypothetical protein